MSSWVKTVANERAFAAGIEKAVRAAAGNDQLSLQEQTKLAGYPLAQATASRAAKAKGAHLYVKDVQAQALSDAHQALVAIGVGTYSAITELTAIKREKPELGALLLQAHEIAKATALPTLLAPTPVEVKLDTTTPGISLKPQTDGSYIVRVEKTVPANSPFTLSFAGTTFNEMTAPRGWTGYWMGDRVPEGYGVRSGETKELPDAYEATILAAKDPVGSLTIAEAIRVARHAIVEHLKSGRMQQGDWTDYFPSSWADASAVQMTVNGKITYPFIEGIMNFGGTDAEIRRNLDSYVIIGRGPFDLYSEVTVKKDPSAKVQNVLVEID